MKLKTWLETRRSAKHRAEIAKMLRSFGMTDLKSFIDISLDLPLQITVAHELVHLMFRSRFLKLRWILFAAVAVLSSL